MTNEEITTPEQPFAPGITWGAPDPGTGERTIKIGADSTAEASAHIKRLVTEVSTTSEAPDLCAVTWDMVAIYGIADGIMVVEGHLPAIGNQAYALFRLLVAPLDTRNRIDEETGKQTNDAAAILHMLGIGNADRLAATFAHRPFERTYTFLRDTIV